MATEAERARAGDPRPSIESRYPTRERYVAGVTSAAQLLVADRILLAEDGDAYVNAAAHLAWPPASIDQYPFWRLEPAIEIIETPAAAPIF